PACRKARLRPRPGRLLSRRNHRPFPAPPPLESTQSGNRASDDQGMDVMRALVRIDRLEVGGMAHHLELRGNAIAAVHVARRSGDIERLPAIVAFDEADGLRDQLSGLEAAPDTKRGL